MPQEQLAQFYINWASVYLNSTTDVHSYPRLILGLWKQLAHKTEINLMIKTQKSCTLSQVLGLNSCRNTGNLFCPLTSLQLGSLKLTNTTAESTGCHIYNQQLKPTFFWFPSDKSSAQSGETMEKHIIAPTNSTCT